LFQSKIIGICATKVGTSRLFLCQIGWPVGISDAMSETINIIPARLGIAFRPSDSQAITGQVIDDLIHFLTFRTFMDSFGSQTSGSHTIPYYSKYFNDHANQMHFPKLTRTSAMKCRDAWTKFRLFADIFSHHANQ
jgi:hypothetical protein